MWTSTPASTAFTDSTIRETGWTAPTSLFASMTDTSAVLPGLMAAATAAGSTMPHLSTPTLVTSHRPCSSSASTHARIAGCSMLDTTTCVRSSRRLAAMAQLSASLPQLQKVISLLSA